MANEKRLIDANALMDSFREYMVERYDKEKCVSEENCKTCDKSCLWRKKVSAAPAVDAVEVVHGRWLNTQIEAHDPFGYYMGEVDVFTCSVCGVQFDVSECRNYCPNCGAKMDGDGNGSTKD